MFDPRRRFAHGVLLLAAADLAGRSILFILSPVLTRLLTPAQYGGYALLLSLAAVLALVQYGGMDSAFPFFRANERTGNEHGILVAACVVATIAIVAVVGATIVLGVGTGWLSQLTGLTGVEVLIFTAGLLPAALSSWLLYVLRFTRQTSSFVRVNVIGQIGGPVLGVPAMMAVPRDQRLTVFLMVILAAQLTAFLWAQREFARVGVRLYERTMFSAPLAREMVRYGVRLVPAFVLYALCAHSGRFLLGWFSGPDAVSVLAIAALLTSAALIVRAWFSFFWDPHLTEWISREKPETYLRRLDVAVVLIATVAFLLASLAVVWADLIVSLLYPDSYRAAAGLVPFLLWAGAAAMLSAVAISTVLVANSVRYHLRVYGVAFVLNVGAGLLLVPGLGAKGAVVAALVTEAFILGFWIVLGKYGLKNLPLDWRIVFVQGSLSIALAVWYQPAMFWPAHALAERVAMTGSLLVVFGAVGVWALRGQWPFLRELFRASRTADEGRLGLLKAVATIPAGAEES